MGEEYLHQFFPLFRLKQFFPYTLTLPIYQSLAENLCQYGVIFVAILFQQRDQILDFARTARLPAIYPFRDFVDAGGLMSYSLSSLEVVSRTARYVDKILKGAKPADLPVEEPTTYELVINMKTTKALGLVIPPSLLLRAHQVIE